MLSISNLFILLQLYVWDESGYLPLLVRNKAAEILFGNIRAERVYFCYREQNQCGNPDPKDVHKDDQCSAHVFDHPKAAAGFVGSCLPDADRNLEWKAKQCCGKKMNFYLMWLIFLKILLQQGNNSPLKIEVTVNANLDRENGRFEMVSVLMPCFRAKWSNVHFIPEILGNDVAIIICIIIQKISHLCNTCRTGHLRWPFLPINI